MGLSFENLKPDVLDPVNCIDYDLCRSKILGDTIFIKIKFKKNLWFWNKSDKQFSNLIFCNIPNISF